MSEPYRFVAVAVPVPLRQVFHYRLVEDRQVAVGSRVLVPFGSRKLVGVVLANDIRPDVDIGKIRNVLSVFDADGNLPPAIIRLCRWAADYYHHPIGEVIAAALPGLVRKGKNPSAPDPVLTLTDTGNQLEEESLGRAHAQRKLITALRQSPLTRSQLKSLDISSQVIRVIESRQWATWASPKEPRPADLSTVRVNYGGLHPTQEQGNAITAILTRTDSKPFLLHGVTGSGKTEVYLRVIEPLLQAGLQVLVLVPEIGLTPQTIARFRNRFDVPVTIVHSSLTDRERATGWSEATEGRAGIILGTRSAVFTPLRNPGAIIIDEEHDASYKQQDGFRYSARDLAVLRGQFEQVPVILGSATPSLESLHNVETGKYHMLHLRTRPPGVDAEKYELLDTRHLELTQGLTRALRRRIGERLGDKEQVLVFINRRGFAPVMMCNDCHWIAHCRRCDAKLTYHLSTQTLVCHHCGTVSHNIISCQHCRSSNIAPIGLGTQRIEKSLSELYPDYPVLRIDRDSTRKKGTMENFVSEISSGNPAILVGTQLLAKGHHFPNVTLVALLEIDSGFYSADFRAIEKLGQVILQVGGRAGRADKAGTVLIQTAFASHPLMETLVTQGYHEFAQALLKERRETELPPYSFNALIRAEASEPSAARKFLETLAGKARVRNSVSLLGPIPALMEKKAGRYRQLLIVTSAVRRDLHHDLDHIIELAEGLPDAKKVRWAVDVDPVDLF